MNSLRDHSSTLKRFMIERAGDILVNIAQNDKICTLDSRVIRLPLLRMLSSEKKNLMDLELNAVFIHIQYLFMLFSHGFHI